MNKIGLTYLLVGFDGPSLVPASCSVRRFCKRASTLADGGGQLFAGLRKLKSPPEHGDNAGFGCEPFSPDVQSLCKAQVVQTQFL